MKTGLKFLFFQTILHSHGDKTHILDALENSTAVSRLYPCQVFIVEGINSAANVVRRKLGLHLTVLRRLSCQRLILWI